MPVYLSWPIIFLKSLSSLILSRYFWMFSCSFLSSCDKPESGPAYFCFRAWYWFFLISSRSTYSYSPVMSFILVCSLALLWAFQLLRFFFLDFCRAAERLTTGCLCSLARPVIVLMRLA